MGNQTKPKHVLRTPYWVITNTNTGRKCSSMIEHIMQSMQFPAELIEKVAELSKTLQTKDKALWQPQSCRPTCTTE